MSDQTLRNGIKAAEAGKRDGAGSKTVTPEAMALSRLRAEVARLKRDFVDAFGFATRERLKFRTGDSILQVYRAIYPSKLVPDSLELETLAIDVEAFYGVELDALWREDITLGELFASTLGAAQP